MRRQRVVKLTLAAGMVGLLILPALVYTQVTGRVLNPRLRQTYPDLSSAVAAAAANDTLLVSGTLTDGDAILDSGTDTPPAGLKIVAGRGLRGTLQVSAAACGVTTNGAILDVSARAGALTIQGLRLVVPNGCIGVYSDGTVSGGNPLTVQGVLFTGATATAVFTAIETVDELDGPFNFTQNTITGQLNPGISLDGDGTTAIQATIFRNRITNTGTGGSGNGIGIADVPAGSVVGVRRNRINGGGAANGIGTGIYLTGGATDGVVIENNTIENFAAGGTGFAMDNDDDGVEFRRNVVRNNDVGISVDFTGGNPTILPTITLNNITGDPATQTGLQYTADSSDPNLDATNNWWGANTGPGDDGDGDTNDCCTPTGSGLPVVATAPSDSCGAAPPNTGRVSICPFRTAPVSPAGA
jgi:hypothetical protein